MTEPIPPSQDPWYTLPENASLTAPGVILRLRPNPPLAAAVKASLAYQLLYTTTDAVDQPSWAVTTLFIPENANKHTLLSYQIPYNSPCLDKSPSWIYHQYKDPALEKALKEGWWVNVPDHEGPEAAFGAEVGQGYATLDSIRAVLASDLGLANNSSIALWGYSGGALASGFAAELQLKYAPELNVVGICLGGPGANIQSAVYAANKSHYAGLVALSLVGATRVYPEAYEELLEQLKPETKERFFTVKDMDPEHAFNFFENEDMWAFFHDGDQVLEQPAIKEMTERNWFMGRHGVPQAPVFVYHAIKDEIAHIEHVDKLVNTYCEGGARILYERNTHPDHIGESRCSRPRAIAWLRSAFSGRLGVDYPAERKVVRDVTVVEDSGFVCGHTAMDRPQVT